MSPFCEVGRKAVAYIELRLLSHSIISVCEQDCWHSPRQCVGDGLVTLVQLKDLEPIA